MINLVFIYFLSLLFFLFQFFFYFTFGFILLFFILNLDDGCDIILCMMVTQVTKCNVGVT